MIFNLRENNREVGGTNKNKISGEHWRMYMATEELPFFMIRHIISF